MDAWVKKIYLTLKTDILGFWVGIFHRKALPAHCFVWKRLFWSPGCYVRIIGERTDSGNPETWSRKYYHERRRRRNHFNTTEQNGQRDLIREDDPLGKSQHVTGAWVPLLEWGLPMKEIVQLVTEKARFPVLTATRGGQSEGERDRGRDPIPGLKTINTSTVRRASSCCLFPSCKDDFSVLGFLFYFLPVLYLWVWENPNSLLFSSSV